jgi:hypothetical protein
MKAPGVTLVGLVALALPAAAGAPLDAASDHVALRNR